MRNLYDVRVRGSSGPTYVVAYDFGEAENLVGRGTIISIQELGTVVEGKRREEVHVPKKDPSVADRPRRRGRDRPEGD